MNKLNNYQGIGSKAENGDLKLITILIKMRIQIDFILISFGLIIIHLVGEGVGYMNAMCYTIDCIVYITFCRIGQMNDHIVFTQVFHLFPMPV